MNVGDRVRVKGDSTETIWVIQEIKNDYAFCIVADYYDMRPGNFLISQLVKVLE